MLNYKTLDFKGITNKQVDDNTEYYIDLLSKVVDPDYEISGGTVVVANEYYVGRPDLISLAVYGTDQYADIICKVNGISNPFELNEDMILYCPSVNNINQLFKWGAAKTPSDKASDADSIITKKNNTKLKTEYRSPADATIDSKNYVINKTLGLVFY